MKAFVFSFAILGCFLCASAGAAVYPAPNPTFDASSFTTWTGESVGKSRRANVYVPFTAADGSADMISVMQLDLVGNDYERGYAHGYLMAKGTIHLFS